MHSLFLQEVCYNQFRLMPTLISRQETIGMAELKQWPGFVTLRLLANGTYSRIYEIKKKDNLQSRSYALKVISVPGENFQGGQNMPDDIRRSFYQGIVDDIYQEISAVGELSVKNPIVTYYECEVVEYPENGSWDVVIRMELLTPILQYMVDHVLSDEDIFRLYYEISNALAKCHSAGIIHGDVSLDSIYIDENDHSFKLGGFGLRRLVDARCSSKEDDDALNALVNELRSLNAQNQEARQHRGSAASTSRTDSSFAEEEQRLRAALRERERKLQAEQRRREQEERARREREARESGDSSAQAAAQAAPEQSHDPFAGQSGNRTQRKTARDTASRRRDTWPAAGKTTGRESGRDPWNTAYEEGKRESGSTYSAGNTTGTSGSSNPSGYPGSETAWRRTSVDPAAQEKADKRRRGRKAAMLAAGITAGVIGLATVFSAVSSDNDYQYTPTYEYTEEFVDESDPLANSEIPSVEQAEAILAEYMDEADHTEVTKGIFGSVEREDGYSSDENRIYTIYYDYGEVPSSITIYEDDDTWTPLYDASYSDGHLRWFTEYEDSYTLRRTSYNEDGSLFYANEYDRDADGGIIEERNYEEDGRMHQRSVYEGSSNDPEAMTTWYYDNSGNVKYFYETFYDENGNAVTTLHHDSDGKLVRRYETEYKKINGYYYQSVETVYDEEENVMEYRVEYDYDGSGDLKKAVYYDAEGNVTNEYNY